MEYDKDSSLVSTITTTRAIAQCSEISARDLIPYEEATKWGVLPVRITSDLRGAKILHVAIDGAKRFETERYIRFLTGMPIKASELPAEVVQEAIFIAYQGSEERLKKCLAKLSLSSSPTEKVHILWGEHSSDVLSLLEALIEYSLAHNASDLHLCPNRDGTFARLRINGELRSTEESVFSPAIYQTVVRRLKILSNLEVNSKIPQDGSLLIPTNKGAASTRISIVPTIHGEKIALRFFNSSERRTFSQLGFSLEIESALLGALSYREGLIVVGGPTGSGKTTTLYSLIETLAERPLHVMSIEDPVERMLPNVSQLSVDPKLKVSFSSGLRAILRQDPDVILIGEIRDEETAVRAIEAATTGHLVLCSIHAFDLESIVERFSQLSVVTASLLPVVKMLIAQQLYPRLCDHCKVVKVGVEQEQYQPVGCHHCDYSGFSGRVLVAECGVVSKEGVVPFGDRLLHGWSALVKHGIVSP